MGWGGGGVGWGAVRCGAGRGGVGWGKWGGLGVGGVGGVGWMGGECVVDVVGVCACVGVSVGVGACVGARVAACARACACLPACVGGFLHVCAFVSFGWVLGPQWTRASIRLLRVMESPAGSTQKVDWSFLAATRA